MAIYIYTRNRVEICASTVGFECITFIEFIKWHMICRKRIMEQNVVVKTTLLLSIFMKHLFSGAKTNNEYAFSNTRTGNA